MPMDRRRFILAGFAAPLALRQAALAGDEPDRIPIGDMHAHLFFIGPNTPASRPLAHTMAAGNASLVAWSLVGDLPWLRRSARGLSQKGAPERGEPIDWLKAEIGRIKAHISGQGLKVLLKPEDVDRALDGEPHVVLAVEGATFIETDVGPLRTAYDLGVRHLQLVHYIDNPLADLQTAKPRHGGLSELGREVIAECNRLGILIDLAHTSEEAVGQALALSKAPMVWSHGSVTRTAQPHWSMPATKARQLTFTCAKAIADKGGVVGLWALRSDVGSTTDAYAERLAQMADWLGEDHAAFGTDMNAISNPPIKSYADLQRVVGHWRGQGMPEARIRKLAIGNYARVLKQALSAKPS
jgi:membrane dipeptidase